MDFRNIFTGRIVKTHRNQWQTGYLRMPLSSFCDTRKMLKIHRCFILPINHGGIVTLDLFTPHRICVCFRPINDVVKRQRHTSISTQNSLVFSNLNRKVAGF